MASHIKNGMSMTRIRGVEGTLPLSSPRFIFRMLLLNFPPETTICSAGKCSPIFLTLSVNQALKIPPFSGDLKNALCSGGTRPMIAPVAAPTKGAYINA